MATKKKSGFDHIWRTLSAIDVGEYIEKKGKLSYLSWAFAQKVMLDHFPDTVFEFTRFGDNQLSAVYFPDGTAEVECVVTVSHGGDSYRRSMWLPVMDNRNNAIKNPTARQISDTKMRCYVKCLGAGFGLGLYIYAGEDIPVDAYEPPPKQGEGLKRIEEWAKKSGIPLSNVEDFYHLKKDGAELRNVSEKSVLSFLAWLESDNGKKSMNEYNKSVNGESDE